MSSDFAPELRAHEYGPTPEDSMHRSLDDHLKHPASGERLSASREQAPSDVGVAPLADAPDDVSALAEVLGDIRVAGAREADWWTNDEDHHLLIRVLRAECIPWAEGLLASDWLAARDADLTARAEAAAAERIAPLIARLADAWQIDTTKHVGHCDGDCWECAVAEHMAAIRRLAADVAAAAPYTRDGADGEADHG